MTNKKLYKNFCDNNTTIPLFLQPFWLDTIAEKWEVVLVSENDKIKAALPFCVKGNLFTKRIYLPDVNFYQTPVFAENITLNQKQKLTEELFKQLREREYRRKKTDEILFLYLSVLSKSCVIFYL